MRTTINVRLGRKALAALVLALALGAAGCGVVSPKPTALPTITPGHTDVPPVGTPPSAQNVASTDTQGPPGTLRLITFQSSEAPAQILAWYEQALLPAGWQKQSADSQSDYVLQDWCPMYLAHIDAAAQDGSPTQVQVQLRPVLGDMPC